MKHNGRTIWVVLLLATLCACTGEKSFVLRVSDNSGQSGSVPETAYLERFDVSGISTIDSAKTKSVGEYTLSAPVSDAPAFYRLRKTNGTYTFVVEANVSKLKMKIEDSVSYRIENSEANRKMAEYLSLEKSVNDSIKAETARFGTDILHRDSLDARILAIVKGYKDSVRQMVYANPSSPVAYYALFRKLAYGITPFNPSDKKDLRLYSAVATAWHTHFKGSARDKQLYNFVTKARSNLKIEDFEPFFMNAATVSFPNLSFADSKGKTRSLHDLRGKYILLDFCVYSQMSPSDYLLFKNVYDKYKPKGLEIYQVSFDTDPDYWKRAVADLPWTCVNDANGLSVPTYNITSLPYNYLIDKSGNIVAKNISPDMIGAWIK